MTIAELENHKALASAAYEDSLTCKPDDYAGQLRFLRYAFAHLLRVVENVGALQMPPAVEPPRESFRREDGDGDSVEVAFSIGPGRNGRPGLTFLVVQQGGVLSDEDGRVHACATIAGDSVEQFQSWIDRVIERYGAKIK